MTNTALSSPADNWFIRLNPGLHPIMPRTTLHITSAIWLGESNQKTGRCTLFLYYADESSLDKDDIQHTTQPSNEEIPLQLRKETIRIFLASEASEIPLNFILEGQQSYVFELDGHKEECSIEECDIMLLGVYLHGDRMETGIQTIPYSEKGNDVQFEDELIGTGAAVQIGSKVTVWYSAKVVETNVLYEEVNASNGEPAMFCVGSRDVIQGWDEGMIGMRSGGKRTITIPPHKAYGHEGNGTMIPPNATIQIKCVLIGIF